MPELSNTGLDIEGNDIEDNGTTLYDSGNSWIPVAILEADSITVGNTSISLGGSGTPDASELSGSSGTQGQVLQTDGSSASWVTFSSGASVSDDGTQVLSSPDDVNYGSNLDVTDDGDGSVTVDAAGGGGSTQTVDGDKTLQQVIRFGSEGSTTTSSSYVTIEESDIALDFDDFEDNNVYVKLEAHLENDRDFLQDNVETTSYSDLDSIVRRDSMVFVESQNQYYLFDDSTGDVDVFDTSFSQVNTLSPSAGFGYTAGLTYRESNENLYAMDGTGDVEEYDDSMSHQATNTNYSIESDNDYINGMTWDNENSRFLVAESPDSTSTRTIEVYEVDTNFQNKTLVTSYSVTSLNQDIEEGGFHNLIYIGNDTVIQTIEGGPVQHRSLSDGSLIYNVDPNAETSCVAFIGADGSFYFYLRSNNDLYQYGEITYARVARQNAGTAVSNTEVAGRPPANSDWDFAETGWIDMSSESGKESYQLQLRRKGSNSTPSYNSVLLKIATN